MQRKARLSPANWGDLPLELKDRIISMLGPHDVSVSRVDKCMYTLFNQPRLWLERLNTHFPRSLYKEPPPPDISWAQQFAAMEHLAYQSLKRQQRQLFYLLKEKNHHAFLACLTGQLFPYNKLTTTCLSTVLLLTSGYIALEIDNVGLSGLSGNMVPVGGIAVCAALMLVMNYILNPNNKIISRLEERDHYGNSLITVAAEQNNQALLDTLYGYANNFHSEYHLALPTHINTDTHQFTLLHWAVLCHQPAKEVTALIRTGARVDSVDYHGRTPLTLAVMFKRTELIRLLLAHGADYLYHDHEMQCPFSLASMMEMKEELSWMLDTPQNHTNNVELSSLLTFAAREGYHTCIRLLLNKGVDVNRAVEDDGMTALMYACSAGCIEIVALMLNQHASVHTHDQQGRMPLHYAVYAGNLDCVRLLLQHGAPVNRALITPNLTPMHFAIITGNDAMVTLLLEHGEQATTRLHNPDENFIGTLTDIPMLAGNINLVMTAMHDNANFDYAAFASVLGMTELVTRFTDLRQRASSHKHLM